MKPFERLTYSGQIRRMRRLARKALAAYGLDNIRLTTLLYENNTVFRVDAADGARYVLRIHLPDRAAVGTVRSEMSWLAAIRRDTELIVPEPVLTQDGNLLTAASEEGVPGQRICVLFGWLPGRFVNDGLTPSHLERVGEFMARLQLHGAQFEQSKGFVRGRLDNLTEKAHRAAAKGISESVARQQLDNPTDEADAIRLVGEVCSPEDGERVAALIQRTRAVQRVLGSGPETFGLIHADLHQDNYFFHRGQVQAIDFDDCGFGHHLYDLAVTLSEVVWRNDGPALRAGLLAGYRRVRPLPAEHERYLDTLIAFRYLQLIIWKIELRNHPAHRDDWETSVNEMLQDIGNFIESEIH